MVLVITITVDLAAKTVILNSTSSGNLVENITYSQALNQVTFATRPDILISISDYMSLINQINIFQTAILFNFIPSVIATTPFGSCENLENHDSIANTWGLACIYGASPRVINYSCSGSTKLVDLIALGSSKTIEFPEWLYLLPALNHYKFSLTNF